MQNPVQERNSQFDRNELLGYQISFEMLEILPSHQVGYYRGLSHHQNARERGDDIRTAAALAADLIRKMTFKHLERKNDTLQNKLNH